MEDGMDRRVPSEMGGLETPFRDQRRWETLEGIAEQPVKCRNCKFSLVVPLKRRMEIDPRQGFNWTD